MTASVYAVMNDSASRKNIGTIGAENYESMDEIPFRSPLATNTTEEIRSTIQDSMNNTPEFSLNPSHSVVA